MASFLCVFCILSQFYFASTKTVLLTPTNNKVDGAHVNISEDTVRADKWPSMDMLLYLNNDSWGFSDNSSTYFELIINGEKDQLQDISFTLVLNAEDVDRYLVLDIFMNNDDTTTLNPYHKIYPFCDNSSLLSFDSGRGFGGGFYGGMSKVSNADTAEGRVCDIGADYTPCTEETSKTSFMLPKTTANNSFPVRIKIYSDPTYGWLGGYTSITYNNVQQCNFLDSFEPNSAIIIHLFDNYGSYNITSFEITQETQQHEVNTTTTSATVDTYEVWRSLDILLMLVLIVLGYMLIPFIVFLVTKMCGCLCSNPGRKLSGYLIELFFIAFLDIIDVISDIFATISLFQKAACGVTSCVFTQHPAFGIILGIATALGTVITIFKNMYLYWFILKGDSDSDSKHSHDNDRSSTGYNNTQSDYTDSIISSADKAKLLLHDLPGLALYCTYFILSATNIGIYPSTITIAAWIISCIDFIIVVMLSKSKSEESMNCKDGVCGIRKGSCYMFWVLIVASIYGLTFGLKGNPVKPVYSVNGECVITLSDWSERSYYEYNGHKMWFYIENDDSYDQAYLVPQQTTESSDCDIGGFEWIPVGYSNGACRTFDAHCQGFYHQIDVCFDICRLE